MPDGSKGRRDAAREVRCGPCEARQRVEDAGGVVGAVLDKREGGEQRRVRVGMMKNNVWGRLVGGDEEEGGGDGRVGVSVGRFDGAREGGPSAVGGERVERCEGADGL